VAVAVGQGRSRSVSGRKAWTARARAAGSAGSIRHRSGCRRAWAGDL